ncbi:hypothetical protein OG474_15025 [Kribbella sp. NBC_01505]
MSTKPRTPLPDYAAVALAAVVVLLVVLGVLPDIPWDTVQLPLIGK